MRSVITESDTVCYGLYATAIVGDNSYSVVFS